MVSTREKISTKGNFGQLNETLNAFVIGNNTNADAIRKESLQPQTIGLINNFGNPTVGENGGNQTQVVVKNFADKIRKEVENAVMAVENRVHDAISTGMDNVIIPRVEMAVRSVTESSGIGINGMFQNPNQKDFSANTENTPLMSASSRVDLNIDEDRNDETRNVGNFEDGDFPASRPNYDRKAHAHHSVHKSFCPKNFIQDSTKLQKSTNIMNYWLVREFQPIVNLNRKYSQYSN